ncbi:hypothetical protein [Longispora fulva]|nr:hypothetical protein [Longispora fulva]
MAVTDPIDEQWARAWWCGHLTELRTAANLAGWRDLLDRIFQQIRQGGSALSGFRQLGGQTEPTRDSQSSAGTEQLWSPVHVNSVYHCPNVDDRCRLKASRDEHGRWPLCHLGSDPDGMPMTPIAQPAD